MPLWRLLAAWGWGLCGALQWWCALRLVLLLHAVKATGWLAVDVSVSIELASHAGVWLLLFDFIVVGVWPCVSFHSCLAHAWCNDDTLHSAGT